MSPPFELTSEVRAQMVAATGYDLQPDDPALVFVLLNQIALQDLVKQCASELQQANVQVSEQLRKMRQETLQSTRDDLLVIAEQKREGLRLDLKEAESRAAQIVAGLDTGLKFNKAFWLIAGAIGATLFLFGIIVGGSLARS